MARILVDHQKALNILERAAKAASGTAFSPSRHSGPVRAIIEGSHLTYRYILVTALLAKATADEVNPLALQAKAETEGAYDARSLCHRVIVPNEQRLFLNGLGGSNEPYLNKPARFPMLSLGNAVRNGKDARTLKLIIQTLRGVTTSALSKALLVDALYIARKTREKYKQEIGGALAGVTGGRHQIIAFLQKLLDRPVHGETAALVTAALLWLVEAGAGREPQISLHPVNEAGTSSNQISDVDVYDDSRQLCITAEVKDKEFNLHDVEHAAKRVKAYGHSVLHFFKGPHAKLYGGDENTAVSLCANNGVEVLFIDLRNAIEPYVALAPKEVTLQQLAGLISDFAAQARVKQETEQYIISLLAALQKAGESHHAMAASSGVHPSGNLKKEKLKGPSQ